MKKIIEKGWPFLLFIIAPVIYYSNLFLPSLSVFFTPDLGRSDIFSSFAYSLVMAERLKNLQIPLWNNLLGTGMPLVASGISDFFNLTQLFTRYFFPLPLAFNLFFLLNCFLSLCGMYLLSRHFQFSRFIAVFIALTFSFSGFFIAQITHYGVFSTAAFLPFIFLFGIRYWQQARLRDGLFLAFFIGQQIFAGHTQFVFITMIGLFITIFFLMIFDRDSFSLKRKNFIYLCLAVLFGCSLAAVQLIPAFAYKGASVRDLGLNFNEVTANSLTPKFFLTLIYPFIFGNPARGSYQLYNQGWDIFWEKMGYIGLIPLIFVFVAIFFRKNNSPYKKTFILLLIFSFLLALGRYSPFFFIYYLPPFNFFHIPARFILLVDLALSILAGYGLEIFFKKNKVALILKIIILLLVFIPSLLIYREYQLVVPLQEALKEPPSYQVIKKDPGRIYLLGGGWPYLNHLFSFGWQDPAFYLFAKNGLDTDVNMVYHVAQTGVYYPLLTKRQSIIQNLLINEAQGNFDNFTAMSTPLHRKILNLTGVRFLISPFNLTEKGLVLIKTISSNDKTWPSYNIYQNLDVLPRLRLVGNYQNVGSLEKALTAINQSSFNPASSVVIENGQLGDFDKATVKEIKILKDKDEEILAEVMVDQKNILVLADSYLSDWQALVDDRPTKIYPANINQRAVIVPAGKHIIKFIYQPKSIKLGMTVSLTAFIFWLAFLIKSLLVKNKPG